MKKFLLALCFLATVFSGTAFAQRTATHTAMNFLVDALSGTYSFDIYARKTGATNIVVGLTSYLFDVDNTGGFDFAVAPVMTNVNPKYTIDLVGGTTDYAAMTAQYILVAGVKKLVITITYVDNGNGGGQLVNTAPNGERICRVALKIANPAKTAALTWDLVNSAMLTPTLATIVNTFAGSNNMVLTEGSTPVELTTFTAKASGRNVVLAWKTATETNNAGFEVQRKQAGTDWAKVAYVDGNGSSAVEHSYTKTDVVNDAATYSYRLKQIDRDGRFEYHGEVEVTTGLSATDYTLGANYPNPFNPSTKFTFAVKNNEQVTVKVFNTIGQEVATLFNGVAGANKLYEVNFNASGLASGTYFYMLRTADRYEIKKMLLMK